jgi:hypothetical protein
LTFKGIANEFKIITLANKLVLLARVTYLRHGLKYIDENKNKRSCSCLKKQTDHNN